MSRPRGAGADRDHDLVRAQPAHDVTLGVGHLDLVRAGEPGAAHHGLDVVAGELVADHLDLAPDHVLQAGQQVLDGDVLLEPVAGPVHVAHLQTGQVQHGLAQGLGRDGAGVQADTADLVASFDHRDPAAELGGRDRGLLPAGAGADHDEVEVVPGCVHGPSVAPRRPRDETGPETRAGSSGRELTGSPSVVAG
nr:hypothetical protein GCM10025730_54850 [Promicromonospora thailandica]